MVEFGPFASAGEAPQVTSPVVDVRATSDAGDQLRRCEVGSAEDVPAAPVPRFAARGEVRGRPLTMQQQPHTTPVSIARLYCLPNDI